MSFTPPLPQVSFICVHSTILYIFLYSALSDNEPVYAQVDRHHKTRTPERSQRTHRRHMSACVQVPPVESTDGTDIPVHEQFVNDLTTATDSLNLNAIRRMYIEQLKKIYSFTYLVHVDLQRYQQAGSLYLTISMKSII